MDAGRLASKLNTAWVAVYTTGLLDGQRRRRRGEVESDMHDGLASGALAGVGTWALAGEILSRMGRGVWWDVLWRCEADRAGESAVLDGASPPLPWLSSLFLGAVVLLGAVSTTGALGRSEAQIALAMLATLGAGATWLGLYLVTRRTLGPLLIGVGTACIAWSLWWTFLGPVAAVGVGLAGVRRAHRIEKLLGP